MICKRIPRSVLYFFLKPIAGPVNNYFLFVLHLHRKAYYYNTYCIKLNPAFIFKSLKLRLFRISIPVIHAHVLKSEIAFMYSSVSFSLIIPEHYTSIYNIYIYYLLINKINVLLVRFCRCRVEVNVKNDNQKNTRKKNR